MAESLQSAAIHLLRKLRRADARSGLNAPRLSALSVIVFGGPLTLGQVLSGNPGCEFPACAIRGDECRWGDVPCYLRDIGENEQR